MASETFSLLFVSKLKYIAVVTSDQLNYLAVIRHCCIKMITIIILSRVINYESPFGVHSVMFIPIIERLGTDVQKAKWLPLAKNMKMIGTYAQTELGHGMLYYYYDGDGDDNN